MTSIHLPTCAGCIAQVRHETVYNPTHELHDGTGHVNLCQVLHEQGRCQVEAGRALAGAFHDLAGAIQRYCYLLEERNDTMADFD